MATYTNDQFDELPEDLVRVGAHRGPRVRGGGWIALAWALVSVIVLVVAGLFYLASIDSSFKLPFIPSASTPTATSTPTPTVTPVTDPATVAKRKITVTILNGTATANLQAEAATRLKAAKWTILSTANSSSTTVTKSVVYYTTTADEDVAKGVALVLGIKRTFLTNPFANGAKLTVVLGSDFTSK